MKYSRKNKRVNKTRSKTHKRKMRGGASPHDEGYNSPSSPRTINSRKRNSNPRSAKKAKKNI